MQDWAISLSNISRSNLSDKNQDFVTVHNFAANPDFIIDFASLQKFAKITPQYPGIRAPLPEDVSQSWLETLSPELDKTFGAAPRGWEIQAWFSIVTAQSRELLPLQRFPHVDGTNPNQLAMMLYLHHTEHGGTGFFRHKSTGYTSLNDDTFPFYRDALQKDVADHGLPPSSYVGDGEPFFEKVHESKGAFNEAVFYRGNVLHSGLIRNDRPLTSDPRTGRLTINAFFRHI